MKKILFVLPVLLMTWVYANTLDKVRPVDAEKMMTDKKAIIVDVREPEEIKEGMAKDAQSVPLSLMQNKRDEWDKIIASFPKDKTIVVYCRSGRRSEIVGTELAKKGFKVLNMGTFDSWKEAGLPVIKK